MECLASRIQKLQLLKESHDQTDPPLAQQVPGKLIIVLGTAAHATKDTLASTSAHLYISAHAIKQPILNVPNR